jgi:hypothetical protein
VSERNTSVDPFCGAVWYPRNDFRDRIRSDIMPTRSKERTQIPVTVATTTADRPDAPLAVDTASVKATDDVVEKGFTAGSALNIIISVWTLGCSKATPNSISSSVCVGIISDVSAN